MRTRETFLMMMTSAVLGLVATAGADLSVVNGDFSDTSGLTPAGIWWHGVPNGWSSTAALTDYAVNGGIANLDTLSELSQVVGTLTSNATVTLKFDFLKPWASSPDNLVAKIMAGSNVLAQATYPTTNVNLTLSTFVPAGTTVTIAFEKGNPSAGLDNVSVSAVAAPLTIVNGDFSNVGGLTGPDVNGWYDGVPRRWTSTSGNTAYSVQGTQGTTPPVANLGPLLMLSQYAGVLDYNATVTMTFDQGHFLTYAPTSTVTISDGTITLAGKRIGGDGTGFTHSTYVAAGKPVYVNFKSVVAGMPWADNVSVSAVESPLSVVNGDFSDLTGMTFAGVAGWYGVAPPPGWSSASGNGYLVNNGVANLAWLSPLSQYLGTLNYRAKVTLTFDAVSLGATPGWTANLKDASTTLATLTKSSPASIGSFTLSHVYEAGTPIYIEFVSNSASPGLDNITVSVVKFYHGTLISVL